MNHGISVPEWELEMACHPSVGKESGTGVVDFSAEKLGTLKKIGIDSVSVGEIAVVASS